jgi:hypothetical protein
MLPANGKHQFTPENARLMALRSAESRRRKKAAEQLRQAEEQERIRQAAQNPLPSDAYVAQRLARVRAQLDRIDGMLLLELDPQRLDRLAAAAARLSEVERTLAGRPAPGAYRPSAPRRRAEPGPLLVPE